MALDTDLAGLLPASVTVVFPRDTSADPFAVEVALTDLAIDELEDALTHDGSHVLTGGAIAAGSGTPTNESDLETLAEQVAEDWYRWRLSKTALAFSGLVPWENDGLADAVEWSWEDVSTRVLSWVFNEPDPAIRRAPEEVSTNTITVQEQDGSPSYTGIGTLQVDENTDIDITNPSAGVALLSASPAILTATYSTAAASYTDYRARVVLLPTSATAITTLTATNTYSQADIEGRRLLLIATGRVEISYGDNGFGSPLARTFRWPQFASDGDGSAFDHTSDWFKGSVVLFEGHAVEVEAYYDSGDQFWRVVNPGSIAVRDESPSLGQSKGMATRVIGIGSSDLPPQSGSGDAVHNGIPLYITYGEVCTTNLVRMGQDNVDPNASDSSNVSNLSLWVHGGIRVESSGFSGAPDLRIGNSVGPPSITADSGNYGCMWYEKGGDLRYGVLDNGAIYAGGTAASEGFAGNIGSSYADGVFGFWKKTGGGGWAIEFGAYDTTDAAGYLCHIYYNHSAAADPDPMAGGFDWKRHTKFALWHNTSSGEFFISTGSDFTSITGITQGQPVGGGTATGALYIDGSGNLASSANLTYASDKLTIGNGGTLITTATSAPSSIPSNSIAGPFLTD